MSDVVSIRPRQSTHQYRAKTFTVTFLPATRTWKWEYVHVTELPFEGESLSLQRAVVAAKRQVDKLLRD